MFRYKPCILAWAMPVSHFPTASKCIHLCALQKATNPVEDHFESALRLAWHGAALAQSLSCALLFAHCADEFGLPGRLMWVQTATAGVAKDAWVDPAEDFGLPGDPSPLPCEAPPAQV